MLRLCASALLLSDNRTNTVDDVRACEVMNTSALGLMSNSFGVDVITVDHRHPSYRYPAERRLSRR